VTSQNKPWLSNCYDHKRLPDACYYYADYSCDCDVVCSCSEDWREEAWDLYSERGKEWHLILCPFHGDTNPSMSVNIIKGAFKCFACGVKGGDVLSFYRQLRKINFIEAARQLGAWRD